MCQQSNVAYFYSAYLQCIECLLTQDFTYIPVPPLVIIVKHNASEDKLGQPAYSVTRPLYLFFLLLVFFLKSCLITQVSVRSFFCGIATLESILHTAGVRSRLLDESSSVCIQRIFFLLKRAMVVFCVASLTNSLQCMTF